MFLENTIPFNPSNLLLFAIAEGKEIYNWPKFYIVQLFGTLQFSLPYCVRYKCTFYCNN